MSAMLTASKPRMLSADEFAARPDTGPEELVDGVVQEMPMPEGFHGRLCMMIGAAIFNWVAERDLGTVLSNDSAVRTRTDPDTVRGPDVCFVSYERIPRGPFPRGVLVIPPELVVEVRSQYDTWSAVIAKVAEYLAAGVAAVVVVNPQNESVVVYRDAEEHRTFQRADTLSLPDVLPGFTFPVARLFG